MRYPLDVHTHPFNILAYYYNMKCVEEVFPLFGAILYGKTNGPPVQTGAF